MGPQKYSGKYITSKIDKPIKQSRLYYLGQIINGKCWHNDRATKENLHFDDRKQCVTYSFFFSQCFKREIENIFFVFLTNYKKKTWKSCENTSTRSDWCSSFLAFPYFHSVFIFLERRTKNKFYLLQFYFIFKWIKEMCWINEFK